MFDPQIPHNHLPHLPGVFDYQQQQFVSLLIQANQAIAKLDGLTLLLPNYEVLIHPLLAKESIASNEIENINTTMIKFLQQEAIGPLLLQGAEKEVQYYRTAILHGVKQLQEQWGISTNLLIELQAIIEPNKQGIRKLPGTVIANSSGKILYTPPEGEQIIRNLLANLEVFIHDNDGIDPLIKVGVIHHQFESIHPFYDGNGRIGRILIILYLILQKKITRPVLFLSPYILTEKQWYYNSFRRNDPKTAFDDIITYMLHGIMIQSQVTQDKIITIHTLINQTSHNLKQAGFKDYHTITLLLFSYPFMTIQSFADHMNISRQAVSDLVKRLETWGHIQTMKLKNSKLVYLPSFIDIIK